MLIIFLIILASQNAICMILRSKTPLPIRLEVIRRCERIITVVTNDSDETVEIVRPIIAASRCQDSDPFLCNALFAIPSDIAADNLDELVLFSSFISALRDC